MVGGLIVADATWIEAAMSPTHQPVHHLARQVRHVAADLLADLPELHDELMCLVWGPRFDREHALGLIARRPQASVCSASAMLAAADAFDAMQTASQRRVRELIRKHRALSTASALAMSRDDAELLGVRALSATAAPAAAGVVEPACLLARWPASREQSRCEARPLAQAPV